jgi:hypothetical protein
MTSARATGSWVVVVDGRQHQIAAEWDLLSTGGGMITIDGVVVERWMLGVKWPGAQRRFVVHGYRFVIAKRGLTDPELDLFAEQPGFGLPVVRPAPKAWPLVIIVLVALVALGLTIAFAVSLASGARR